MSQKGIMTDPITQKMALRHIPDQVPRLNSQGVLVDANGTPVGGGSSGGTGGNPILRYGVDTTTFTGIVEWEILPTETLPPPASGRPGPAPGDYYRRISA